MYKIQTITGVAQNLAKLLDMVAKVNEVYKMRL
jgi:hypothetical protein